MSGFARTPAGVVRTITDAPWDGLHACICCAAGTPCPKCNPSDLDHPPRPPAGAHVEFDKRGGDISNRSLVSRAADAGISVPNIEDECWRACWLSPPSEAPREPRAGGRDCEPTIETAHQGTQQR